MCLLVHTSRCGAGLRAPARSASRYCRQRPARPVTDQPSPGRTFDHDQLELLDRELEVDIETVSPSRGPHRTTIWIVVADGVVYARSWRGAEGRWFQEISDEPRGALHVRGRRLPIVAVPATDPASVEACSTALKGQTVGDPSTPAMARAEILDTTLRLEPA